MTISEVLTELAKIYPDAKPHQLHANIDRSWYGNGVVRTSYYIHVPSNYGAKSRCWSSERSWEHVLAIAKADNDDVWPEVNEPLEVA